MSNHVFCYVNWNELFPIMNCNCLTNKIRNNHRSQQLAQQQMNQPLAATQQLGSGITGLVSGYPGGIQTQTQPTPSAFQQALGTGATLAGIYGAFRGRNT